MRFTKISVIAVAVLAFWTGIACADSLENLERERAILIEAMLNPELSPAERQQRIDAEKRRLVDLERMVLRDDALKGKNTPVVRKAFSNYDLTFLVHASTEKKLSLMDNWLEQVGVSTQTLMAARKGLR
ncbi:MAG: hypothetical protein AB7E79_06935 [Rhodospirillaceae bacterium]